MFAGNTSNDFADERVKSDTGFYSFLEARSSRICFLGPVSFQHIKIFYLPVDDDDDDKL